MKRFSLFLSLLLVVFCLYLLPLEAQAVEAANGTCGDNITWSLDENGLLTISGNGAMSDYSTYPNGAPWYLHREAITAVIIEEGVTRIGSRAFEECEKLANVSVPNSITSIGDWAFNYCSRLTNIDLPEGLTSIEGFVFHNSGLEKIDIPRSVTNIADSAFYCATKLAEVTFARDAQIQTIPVCAFGDTDLKNLRIPASVKNIGGHAFQGTRDCSITFEGDAPAIDSHAFGAAVATVYYPENNTTWTDEIRQNYGGTITWVAYVKEDDDSNVSDGVGEGNYSGDVTGSYVAGVESNGTVFSVDITWTAMNFTYHAADDTVWDVETHQYVTPNEAYWDGEGTITVTNHSNAKISAVATYAAKKGYESANVDFSTDVLVIASAADKNRAETGIITVTPTGSLPKMEQTDTIGFITITITPGT